MRVNHFIHDIGIHTLNEIFRVEIDIINARREFRSVVVTQAVSIKMIQPVLALIKVPRDLDIFAPFTVT